jgi:CHAD domain-containing protein
MAKTRKTPEAAAAAAVLTGTTAVGGKLAWDKVSARRKRRDARAYRLARTEFVPDGMRRIARGQLDLCIEGLERQPNRKLDESVHDTRKRLKRLRASLRLQRAAIGDDTYRRENVALRDTGRKLSAPRDAAVLVETLDDLTRRFSDELPAQDVAPLRERLESAHEQAVTELADDEATIARVRAELEDARTRSAAWTYDVGTFEALRPGLERIYRRGRKRMRAAAAETTDESLHEWRKRSKDLWHALQIVRPASPKRLKRLAKQAHDLSDLLGDDHDLAVLRGHVERRRGAWRTALLAVIDRRRAALQHDAFQLGAKVYERSPKRFARSIERRWRKRAGTRPRPVAG